MYSHKVIFKLNIGFVLIQNDNLLPQKILIFIFRILGLRIFQLIIFLLVNKRCMCVCGYACMHLHIDRQNTYMHYCSRTPSKQTHSVFPMKYQVSQHEDTEQWVSKSLFAINMK